MDSVWPEVSPGRPGSVRVNLGLGSVQMGPATKGYGIGKHYFEIRFSMWHYVEHASIQI